MQASLRLDYELIDGIRLGVGARNLFDDNYQPAEGFPEQGRSFFASVRAPVLRREDKNGAAAMPRRRPSSLAPIAGKIGIR